MSACPTIKTEGLVSSTRSRVAGSEGFLETTLPTILRGTAEVPKLTWVAMNSPFSSVMVGDILRVASVRMAIGWGEALLPKISSIVSIVTSPPVTTRMTGPVEAALVRASSMVWLMVRAPL